MQRVRLYDEKALAQLVQLQKKHGWDLEKSISWQTPIDFQKPLVPLDAEALLFPGASSEQRLVISQMMGLMIAASICEMEETLIRVRRKCWDEVKAQYPVSPEFNSLGEQFFEEEVKHSAAFRRYMEKFSIQLGVPYSELLQLLPRIQGTKTEWFLKQSLKGSSLSFWWIVATVEQQFLFLYHSMRPHKDRLEPLYFDLHEKHFEEEARHAPFPYLMIELMSSRAKGPLAQLHAKGDLIVAQFVQLFWALSTVSKVRSIERMKKEHPFFEVLHSCLPILDQQPLHVVLWQLLTSTPYVSSLVNLTTHRRVLRFAEKVGSLRFPFPHVVHKDLVNY